MIMLIIVFLKMSATSLLISGCNFSSLILSSGVMISFCILSKRLFLRSKGLSDARVVIISKKENGFKEQFLIIHSLFNFLFVWNFHNKKMCSV